VCVVCRRIGGSGRGALQRRGRSAGKRVGGKGNAELAEPVRKGNHGSDEGDPKQPSVSEKVRRAEEGGARKTRRGGGERAGRKLAGFDVEFTEEVSWWQCLYQHWIRLCYYNLIYDERCPLSHRHFLAFHSGGSQTATGFWLKPPQPLDCFSLWVL
jgi:hypothetical protein